jgi:pimeloyl-ACP methyl ester carboxylesterase
MIERTAFPRLDAWRAAGHTFRFADHDAFYRAGGIKDGADALLLLHGFPTSSWDWHALWEPLAQRYRVVAPDLLGFGFSAKPRDVFYTIGLQADLVEALLAELGIRKVHLLAHDYGDTVAQELLARVAERDSAGSDGLHIASTCLLNGGLFPETHRARFIQKLLASPVGPLIARLVTRRGFERSFSAIFGAATQPDAESLAEFWAIVSERDGVLLAPSLLGYMEERRRHRDRWVSALRGAATRIRLIDGVDDPVSGAHMVERYRALIHPADVVELPGIGHYPQCEAPEAVLDAFLRFQERIASL